MAPMLCAVLVLSCGAASAAGRAEAGAFPESRLVNLAQGAQLNTWANQTVDQRWELCYSSFGMNKTAEEFHRRCDRFKPTITVAHNSLNRTFGGFADAKWNCFPKGPTGYCYSGTSACFIFQLGPEEPERFAPTGTDTGYQSVSRYLWPSWGYHDLYIGSTGSPGANGFCDQGATFVGRPNQICGGGWDGAGKCEGLGCWGETQLEVWRLATVKDELVNTPAGASMKTMRRDAVAGVTRIS